MHRVVCFADSNTVATGISQLLGDYEVHTLSASQLTADVRNAVKSFAPDLILLELTRSMDNAHLYFFLRADQKTRNTPIILVSPSDAASQHAAILQPDGIVSRTGMRMRLRHLVKRLLPQVSAQPQQHQQPQAQLIAA